jgi:hypothetical protein
MNEGNLKNAINIKSLIFTEKKVTSLEVKLAAGIKEE